MIAEKHARPLAIIGQAGVIELLNSAMERALGLGRFEGLGRSCSEVFAEPDGDGSWLAQALGGALTRHEIEARDRLGRRMMIDADLILVGSGHEQALLVSARRVFGLPGEPTSQDLTIDYDVSLSPGTRWQVVRATSSSGPIYFDAAETQCFSLLYNRQSPCDECPLLQSASGARTTARIRKASENAKTQVELITLKNLTADVARLNVRFLSEQELLSIHESKLSHLAETAELTDREQSVFRYLVMGRSLEDVAKILGISSRTVKYHQANLLQKLGADSRTDLVRLLL